MRHSLQQVGGHISPLLVASELQNIRIVDTRHEVTAVFAADAAARLKPGNAGIYSITIDNVWVSADVLNNPI